MTTTATPVEQLPRIQRGAEAWQLATAVNDALLALLEQLDPEEWDAPTVCAPWTVADMVGHVIGATESEATLRATVGEQTTLDLSGPAGGSYRQGIGGPHPGMDAVDLYWILSGRGEPDPAQPVAELLRTRVLF